MSFVIMTAPVVLPWPLRSGLEVATRALFGLGDQSSADFLQPTGEAALVPADSVSWRVFKNPLSLFIGGVAAVMMELAEPRVRTGVWEHTTFRLDPIRRLRRTGLAAMLMVYAARSTAEAMIARVRQMHNRIAGSTPAGKDYRANDPELLNWVQSTAAYGFLQAYHEYVRPLSDLERDRFYAEGTFAARLYGASAATSEAAVAKRFQEMANHLERSEILFEFLTIMRSAPILPLPLRPVQPLLIRAAIDLTPYWLRRIVGLTDHGLNALEAGLVRQIGALADRLVLEINPAVQACRRMRLPANYLYVDDNVMHRTNFEDPPD
jgi:uncharacterized protein (DUF2236 family)